jgi:hypothetical protein
MTALELVTTFSETELAEVSAAINTLHNGHEVSAATSADVEQEAIQVLTKLHRTSPVAKSAGSTLKCGDTTHLVPVTAAGMKAAATIGSVTRHGTPRADQHELQLKIAQAKVSESRGPGYRNGTFSVTMNEAPKFRLCSTRTSWFAKLKCDLSLTNANIMTRAQVLPVGGLRVGDTTDFTIFSDGLMARSSVGGSGASGYHQVIETDSEVCSRSLIRAL